MTAFKTSIQGNQGLEQKRHQLLRTSKLTGVKVLQSTIFKTSTSTTLKVVPVGKSAFCGPVAFQQISTQS